MSSGLGKGIGIPVKLLHEAEGHTVTVRALGRRASACRAGDAARFPEIAAPLRVGERHWGSRYVKGGGTQVSGRAWRGPSRGGGAAPVHSGLRKGFGSGDERLA